MFPCAEFITTEYSIDRQGAIDATLTYRVDHPGASIVVLAGLLTTYGDGLGDRDTRGYRDTHHIDN